MSIFKSCLIAATLSSAALAGAASAHPQLSDAQYLAAARCQALMSSPALGKVDTAMIDGVLGAQSPFKIPAITARADGIRADTARVASHAGYYGKAALIGERDGSCAALSHDVMVATTPGSHSTGR